MTRKIFNQKLKLILKNKTILITGGTGSLGRVLTKRLLSFNPKKIIIFSRTEDKRARAKKEFEDKTKIIIEYIPGSILEKDKLKKALENVDIVFHLAAMKRIEECQQHPEEAIEINQGGTSILTELILQNGNISHIIAASSDKATNPSNIYGNTKKAMEDIFIGAQRGAEGRNIKTKFSLVRGGNFLGSYGSILPIWIDTAKSQKVLEITDPKMKRYTLLLDEAVDLFLWTLLNSKGGQIITREMPIFCLGDLAEVISKIYKVKVKIIGIRIDGREKIVEELISNTEIPFTEEAIYPFNTKYLNKSKKFKIFMLTPGEKAEKNIILNTFDSSICLTKKEIYKMLQQGEASKGEWIPHE
jgi:FlaA1/EpsC-like NDP-sugar epimerase